MELREKLREDGVRPLIKHLEFRPIDHAHNARIEPEFIDPLIEVKTEPHTSERALRRDLQSTFQTAVLAAESPGSGL